MRGTGIVLLGFGGPDCAEAVAPFMRALTGRDPSAEACARIWANYEAIGGASPLSIIARRIAEKLEAELASRGTPTPVRVGMAYWHPLVAEAVGELAQLGCNRVIGISLSPYESKAASGACFEALDRAAAEYHLLVGPKTPPIASLPSFAETFAEKLSAALSSNGRSQRRLVVFTAHSLPLADLVADDPYVSALRAVATRVARLCGLAEAKEGNVSELLPGIGEAFGSVAGETPWLLAYQSKGMRGGEWLGPALGSVLEAAAGSSAVDEVIACPIGFLTDHMETLYDLDIAAAERARSLGLEFSRITPPNDDSKVVSAMADIVEVLLGKGSDIA